jgi:NAD-dependent dihydropyrimidine dehydrogenase PreA subunit
MGKKIVFCNCGGEIISPKRLELMQDSLSNVQAEIIKISDICGLAALNKDRLNAVFSQGNEYLLIGCYSRSMKLLLAQAHVDFTQTSIQFVNYIELADDRIMEEIASFLVSTNELHSIQEIASLSDWPSWYPIIDSDRCTRCGQCADFCLFSVYEKADDRVTVINPQNCKNNCPACARICPHTAIIFPKYNYGGAISGSEKIDEMAEQKRMALDIDNILGGNVYDALEKRKMKRRSIIKAEALSKANEERDNALKEKKTFRFPPQNK